MLTGVRRRLQRKKDFLVYVLMARVATQEVDISQSKSRLQKQSIFLDQAGDHGRTLPSMYMGVSPRQTYGNVSRRESPDGESN